MPLPENLVAGSTGHIAHHNDVHDAVNQLQESFYNVKEYGTTGTANDSVAIQAAIDAVSAAGGGTVFFPAGTYRCAAVLKPKVRLLGSGIGATVLKAVAGSNADVIKGLNFGSLTGKAKAVGDIFRGAYLTEITEMTVDGDKATQSSGYGIRVWGRSHYWHNLIVQNCKSDGIWTEFTTHDAGTPDDALESTFSNIKTLSNGNNGWTYRGPHDSFINQFLTIGNGGWGLRSEALAGSYNGSAVHGSGWNSWLNANSFYFQGSGGHLHAIDATGETGVGIEIAAGSGSMKMTNMMISGHTTGLILRGSNHTFEGQVMGCTVAGIDLNNNVTNCTITVQGVANEVAVKFTSEAGPSTIIGSFNVAAGKSLSTGTPASGDIILLTYNGGAGNGSLVQIPGL